MIKKEIFYLSSVLLVQMCFTQELLDSKYNMLLEETETYKYYKVIPKTRLDTFWIEVTDTIRSKNSLVAKLKSRVNDQYNQITSLNKKLEETQEKLVLSLSTKDSIEFFGVSFSKFAYHVMVWLIIIALAVLASMAYFMFLRSNKLTVTHRKEVEALQKTYDTHRNTSRENQAKLKRELQTAINKLETSGRTMS